ncbi:MAG: hypothetical protein JWR21_169 [Herminiimonas sp.]|nr:hypothetical protein [Herminiimonas sp.]
MGTSSGWAAIWTTIPPGMWTALMAGLAAIAGVLVGSFGNTRRLLRQLTHDADQKQKDRRQSLIREVYLDALEKATMASSQFARMHSVDLDSAENMKPMAEFSAAAAKVMLVSRPETAKLTQSLLSLYTKTVLTITTMAVPVQITRASVKTAQMLFDEKLADFQRINALRTAVNESGAADQQAKFDALSRSSEAAKDALSAALETLNARHREIAQITVALAKQMLILLPPLVSLQSEVLLSMKIELGLDAGLDELRTLMTKHADELRKESNAAIDRMSIDFPSAAPSR